MSRAQYQPAALVGDSPSAWHEYRRRRGHPGETMQETCAWLLDQVAAGKIIARTYELQGCSIALFEHRSAVLS